MLHSEYTMSCYMVKSIVRHTVTSKQDRHFIVLFWTVVLFKHLNANMFFLFVCLSDCKYLLFRCLPDTFLSAQLIYQGKVELCHPLYDFSRKRIEIFFRGRCRPRKLKSAKNNPHVFETKPRKFGDAKISHYMVSDRGLYCLLTRISIRNKLENKKVHQTLLKLEIDFFN